MPHKDIEARRRYNREWTARRRAEWFADKRCVECGAVDDLQLDHIDPKLKRPGFSNIWNWSLSRREAELALCQVLCVSCHKAKSKRQLLITHGYSADRHGGKAMYNRGCRCDVCRAGSRERGRKARALRRVT